MVHEDRQELVLRDRVQGEEGIGDQGDDRLASEDFFESWTGEFLRWCRGVEAVVEIFGGCGVAGSVTE